MTRFGKIPPALRCNSVPFQTDVQLSRYVRAKAAYKGPTLIPKRRAKKHPMAPKRPMSAFLKFSQTRRQRVKKENPDMSNTDVSRLLGEMWRNASPKEKVPYREQEERERAHYKEEIKKFKDEQARADAASRTSHQSVHGYRHYPHPAEDYYHQRSFASQPPITNTFDTLRMDSFEEPVPSSNSGLKPGPFRPLHGHVYPPYRQTYSSATGKFSRVCSLIFGLFVAHVGFSQSPSVCTMEATYTMTYFRLYLILAELRCQGWTRKIP